MNETLKTFLIALATSVTVLFVLGPLMMRLQSPPTPVSTAPQGAAAPANKGETAELTTPNLDGLSISEARKTYRGQGITIIEEGQRADPAAEPGTIIQQNPAGGAPLVQPEIRVTVAKESETSELPDVTGESVDDATQTLEEAGFAVADPKSEASDEPEGTVLKQEPAAAAQVEPGATVTLTVSGEGTGAGQVEVPKLQRMSLGAAKKAITAAGLSVGTVRRKEHEEWSSNRVISSSPAAGEMVAGGSTVDLVVVAPD